MTFAGDKALKAIIL